MSFKETIEGLGAVKPILGDLSVYAGATGMKLTGTVQTLLKLTCDRCLSPYFQSITVPIDETFLERVAEEKSFSREKELTAKDFVDYLSEDGVLDITDIVYQAVTLATPVSCLCGEQCPGPTFPQDGASEDRLAIDKNAEEAEERIDPRWKNLKGLFAKDEKDPKS